MLGRFNKFLKTNLGSALIETCFALPIVLMLTFYILELIKINTCKASVDAITQECTYEFIRTASTANFQNIIKKHVPGYIKYSGSDPDIRYNVTLYTNLETMCSTSPYGGTEISWLTSDGANTSEFIATTTTGTSPMTASNAEYSGVSPQDTFSGGKVLSGHAFVLTFVCRFQFSSAFIQKLFNGGSNTRVIGSKNKGTMFLLWGRGVGICN